MKKRQAVLAALLVGQLLVAAALFLGNSGSGEGQAPTPLLAAADDEIDRMVVSDGENTATLARNASGWELPALSGLPASRSRVATALGELAGIRTDWPVASTASSHDRFEVGEEGFQRRVRLYRGEEGVADFYLGTSPGLRQVHLRRSGEEPVYAVRLNANDLPARDIDWLDKSLLACPDPVRIEGPDYVLREAEAEEESWVLESGEGSGDDNVQEVDRERVSQLTSALAGLRVQGVAPDASPDGAESTGSYLLRVESADEKRRFRFWSADEKYYVKRDDRETVFTLSQYDYDRITGVTRSQLVAEPAP